MTKQDPPTLERIVRDARRQHAAAQYPGDLAADLGLETQPTPSTQSSRPARRLWLTRWVPACAAAVVLLVGGVVLWQALGQHPPAAPDGGGAVVEAVEPSPVETTPEAAPGIGEAPPAIAALIASVPPGGLEKAAQKFDATLVRATQEADKTLSRRWTGRRSPPAPSYARPTVALSIGSIPTPTATDFNPPRGLRLAVPSLTTLRKELS